MSLKSFIITFNEEASSDQVNSVKQKIGELGGSITNEFTLIKGLVVKLPSIHESALQKFEHVSSIEEDQEVKIQ